MTLDRILDHIAHAAAFRALHGVSPGVAALVLLVLAVWALAARGRRR